MSDNFPVSSEYPIDGHTSESIINIELSKKIESFLNKFKQFEASTSHDQASINLLKEILATNPSLPVEDTFSISKPIHKMIAHKVNSNMSAYPVNPVAPNVYKTVIQPFVSPDNTPLDLNLFINHDPSLPSEVIVIDYLNSGELFCNLSDTNINQALPNLNKLYASYLNRPDFSDPNLPVGYNSPIIPYAYTCLSPTNPHSIAWSFPLKKFFKYTQSPKDVPICQYYTHQSSDNSVPVIISSHYKYANTIPGNHSCSHPILSENPFQCSSYNSFSSCSYYSPLQTQLLSKTVASPHSSSTVEFTLTYALTNLGKHMFSITNQTIGEDVNVLVYPSTHSYEQCLQEATSIYNEYIDPYRFTDHTVSENEKSNISDSTKIVEKESYITSLLVG